MPSRDATGKELSGAAKRRLRAERAHLALVTGPPRAAGKAAPGGPTPLEVPPLPATIEATVVWAAVVQARAARLARRGEDPGRVRAVNAVVGAMGKVRLYAKDSEDAVVVLRHHLSQEVDVRGADPPEEPAGLCAWAFWQLAELLLEVATTPHPVDESRVSHRARPLAQLNHVRPQARLDEVRELVKRKESDEA